MMYCRYFVQLLACFIDYSFSMNERISAATVSVSFDANFINSFLLI